MKDKEKEMLAAISVLTKMGYKVNLEGPIVGKKQGLSVHWHIADEVVQDNMRSSDLIQDYLEKEIPRSFGKHKGTDK